MRYKCALFLSKTEYKWRWVIYLCPDFQYKHKKWLRHQTKYQIISKYMQDIYKIPGGGQAAAARPGPEPPKQVQLNSIDNSSDSSNIIRCVIEHIINHSTVLKFQYKLVTIVTTTPSL